MPKVCPVIMCGGIGSRLWPLSQPTSPKQFIPIIGEQTLFEATLDRCSKLPGFDRVVIVTSAKHAALVNSQLGELREQAVVLLEPEGRDSAPAMAAAACWLSANVPDAISVYLASDHYVPDVAAFADAVQATLAAAASGKIITLGIVPSYPATAYGYILPTKQSDHAVPAVEKFVEKPNESKALEYMTAGYLWNSGNFIASPNVLLSEIARFEPDIVKWTDLALQNARPSPHGLELSSDFTSAPKISIDYAVMEKTDRAHVMPVQFSWSDLGAWDSVKASQQGDGQTGNVAEGDVFLEAVTNSYIKAPPGKVVGAAHVDGLAIVVHDDAVLVCPLDNAQSVKQLAELANKTKKALPTAYSKDLNAYRTQFSSWLHEAALPLWATLGARYSSDPATSFFHETLNRSGHSNDMARRMRVQARQSYVYAMAGKLGWPGPWEMCSRIGLSSLESQHKLENGLYRTLVPSEADPRRNDDTYTYDQAFVLLAMASAAQFLDMEAEALSLLNTLIQQRADEYGGMIEVGAHANVSNPQMHMFEALLAWSEVGDSPLWQERLEMLGGLASTHLIDKEKGCIPEFFNADWSISNDQQRIEPGHQFEWSWLLARWSKLGGGAQALEASKRLFEAGMLGVDAAKRPIAVNAIDTNGKPINGKSRFWPQTEWLKAALIQAELAQNQADKDRFENCARLACAQIEAFTATDVKGLWFDELGVDGSMIDGPVPASTFYHIVCAVAELENYCSLVGRR